MQPPVRHRIFGPRKSRGIVSFWCYVILLLESGLRFYLAPGMQRRWALTGSVVRTSACHAVGCWLKSRQDQAARFPRNDIHSFPACTQYKTNSVEKTPASSLAMTLHKRILPFLVAVRWWCRPCPGLAKDVQTDLNSYARMKRKPVLNQTVPS